MLIQEYDCKTAQDLQEALKELMKETLQEILKAELDEHLEYEYVQIPLSLNTRTRMGK